MARLDRQNALAAALQLIGLEPGPTKPVPRLPGLSEPAASWVIATYRQLGGALSSPVLRPSGWDIPTATGLIVELDEEQHFNRYRAATLQTEWAVELPWREAYLRHCAKYEHVALKSHSGAGFWSSTGAVKQFGPAGPRRDLDGVGSPRWKQRAVYDAMRDSLAATGSVSLARLSVHDRLGSSRLGDALRGSAPLDVDELHALIVQRTMSTVRVPENDSTELATQSTSTAWTPVGSAATFTPPELAKRLGYHDESRAGRVVRTYLREKYPDHPKGAPRVLNEEQACDVIENVPRKR